MNKKFNKGDVVKVKASGFQAKIYDYDKENTLLIRFFGRHSLDLFTEEELELVKKEVV